MELRSHIIQLLATPGTDSRFADAYFVQNVVRQTSLRSHQVHEALWGLVGDGLVYLLPAPGASSTDNWQWRLSALGIGVATSGGNWEPRDPEGYLRRLRKHRPSIDEAALRYVEEALRAFNSRCYLATSVMLGVASERVLDGLAGAVVGALGDSAAKLQELLNKPGTTQFVRFTELRKRLEPMRAELPEGLADTLTLDAVADLLRITRNEAGHPSGVGVDEDTAHTHLLVAARYLQKMTLLQEYFRQATAP